MSCFYFTDFVALSEDFLKSNVHTDTDVSIRSTDYLKWMCSASPIPDGFREPRCANANLLQSAGHFTKQLPATINTASTINSQYYKISMLYVPQKFRKTVAGKYNLCCDLHIILRPCCIPTSYVHYSKTKYERGFVGRSCAGCYVRIFRRVRTFAKSEY